MDKIPNINKPTPVPSTGLRKKPVKQEEGQEGNGSHDKSQEKQDERNDNGQNSQSDGIDEYA